MLARLPSLALALALLPAAHAAPAQSAEQFMDAKDRVEWEAGGLYEGRFADGTRFQLELAYPLPAKAPAGVHFMRESYWYPRRFTGERLYLSAEGGAGQPGVLRLLQTGSDGTLAETFDITLRDGRTAGSGQWASSALGKRQSFSLHRLFTYRAVAVQRPLPVVDGQSPQPFVFSALFPDIDDAAIRRTMRTDLAVCEDDGACHNRVMIDWSSPGLLSLGGSVYGLARDAAHGNTATWTSHYRVDQGKYSAVKLRDFLDRSAACSNKVSSVIVRKLRDQELTGAGRGRLDAGAEPRFLALPAGLQFHFDQYEVGSYADGQPAVFVSRAEMGGCVKALPKAD